MRRLAWIAVFLLGGSLTALAAVGIGYTLFGSATYVSPGDNSNRAVKLVSDATVNPAVYSGIDFAVSANLTIDDLNTLSTDYEFIASSCAAGSPRFGIQLAAYPGKTIFVYIGPPPSYTGCPMNVWTNTGNLLTAASLVDTSQLPGGTFYDTWATAQTRYSGQIVTDIFLVSDKFLCLLSCIAPKNGLDIAGRPRKRGNLHWRICPSCQMLSRSLDYSQNMGRRSATAAESCCKALGERMTDEWAIA